LNEAEADPDPRIGEVAGAPDGTDDVVEADDNAETRNYQACNRLLK
jgi:hypothetical protein